jgi:DNA-binding PadR family transcriptional regulator
MNSYPQNTDIQSLLPLSAAVFAILLSLAPGEKHGYAIMKDVSQDEGGALRMGPGTLYGSLDRLMERGLVEETGETDNDRRRYYRLTEFGRRALGAETTRLHRTVLSARRHGLLDPRGGA